MATRGDLSLAARSALVGTNIFVNRDSGALCRVRNVDKDTGGYAYIEVLGDQTSGFGGASSFSMPIADYDTRFGEMWRPATPEDLLGFDDEGYRPPKHVPDDWHTPATG